MPLLLSLIIVFLGVLLYLPANIAWNDVPEFLIAAAYLDISHPAGFPFTAILGTSLSSISIGSLVFRSQLFSVLSFAALILVLLKLAELLSERKQGKTEQLLPGASLLCCLLSVPSFVKQVLTAEAYLLLALASLSLSYLFLRYCKERDHRLLFTAALLGGVLLGNHVALLPSCLLLIVLSFWELKNPRSSSLLILFAALGLSIYLFLPLRSLSNPPLDTGSPRSFKQLIYQITDARDRDLRSAGATELAARPSQYLRAGTVTLALKDAKRFVQSFGVIPLLFAVIGAALLMRKNPKAVSLLVINMLLTQFFFLGWSEDPWTLSYATMSLFVAIAALELAACLKSFKFIAPAFVLLCLLFTRSESLIKSELQAATLRESEYAPLVAKRILLAAPPASILLLESSFFQAKALQKLKGLRPDLLVLPLPALLFPDYFKEIELRKQGGISFDATLAERHPSFGVLPSFLQRFSHKRILIEPNQTVNQAFIGSTSFSRGTSLLFPPGGILSGSSENFKEQALGEYRELAALRTEYQGSLLAELRSYAEARLLFAADALEKREEKEKATELLREACSGHDFCSPLPKTNLASYISSAPLACELYLSIIEKNSSPATQVFNGLNLCWKALSEADKTVLIEKYGEIIANLNLN